MNDLSTAPAIAATRGIPMPRIGAALAGGIFAGIVCGEDGDHALVLLPDTPERMTWRDAMTWAQSLAPGATLPTRSEQAVLFGNLKDQFPDGGWHWSCEQYAGLESYAWCQLFGLGSQYGYHKGLKLRARAVRRLPLTL